MFKDSIEVESKRYTAGQIMSTVKDAGLKRELIGLAEDFESRHHSLHSRLDGTSFVTSGQKDPLHRRTIFARNGAGIYAGKGTGFNNFTADTDWRNVGFEYSTDDGMARRFPIVVRSDFNYDSHRFVGGMEFSFSRYEYVAALMVAKACGGETGALEPVAITKPKQLPVVDIQEGRIKVLCRDGYCDPRFRMTPHKDGMVPFEHEFDRLGIFYYWARDPKVRVYRLTPTTKSNFDLGSDPVASFDAFLDRLGRTVDSVHRMGGCFSEGVVSSLSAQNVSLDGTVLDLDTCSFPQLDQGFDRKEQVNDKIFARRTSARFADFLMARGFLTEAQHARKIRDIKKVF